jgi:hypothetical protein
MRSANARKYSDRRHNRIDVDAGPFVAAQVSVRF